MYHLPVFCIKKRVRRCGRTRLLFLERKKSGLVGRAEQLDLLAHGGLDGLGAGSQQLAGVKALALQILARFDVLAGGVGKAQLAFGVDVDLGNTQGDGLADHVGRDARAAVQDQRTVVGGLMDLVQSLKVQALPVGGVLAVDVADAGSQEIDAQGSDLGALGGVGHFAGTDDAVFLAADGADFGLDGQAVVMGQSHQLGGLGNVLVDGIMAAVEHDGGEAGGHAGLGALVGAVVQVQGHGNGDAQALIHGADHGSHGLETGHILAGTLGNTEDDGAVHLLRSQQDALGPFQVVDVELTDGVMTVTCLQQHIGCVYQHSEDTSQCSSVSVAGKIRVEPCAPRVTRV